MFLKQCLSIRGNVAAIERNSGLLQMALAAVQTMKHKNSARNDKLLATEKLLLQNLADEDGISATQQLTQLLVNRKTK